MKSGNLMSIKQAVQKVKNDRKKIKAKNKAEKKTKTCQTALQNDVWGNLWLSGWYHRKNQWNHWLSEFKNMKKPLLKFKEQGYDHRGEHIYYTYNHEEMFVGVVCKFRVGKFLHWVFCPDKATFFTNGCLREIVEFITSLYKKDGGKKWK